MLRDVTIERAADGGYVVQSVSSASVFEASELLWPLTEALGRYVLSAQKLHADDTPVPVLCPGRGTTKQGRLCDQRE